MNHNLEYIQNTINEIESLKTQIASRHKKHRRSDKEILKNNNVIYLLILSVLIAKESTPLRLLSGSILNSNTEKPSLINTQTPIQSLTIKVIKKTQTSTWKLYDGKVLYFHTKNDLFQLLLTSRIFI
jgi:hypothetical protein